MKLPSLCVMLLASFALAQGTEGPSQPPEAVVEQADSPEAKAAIELVRSYLTLVKAKKWPEAKKLVHPKTLEAIAERKKRLGKEEHPMAAWYHDKVDVRLTAFTVKSGSPSVHGTFIVDVSEDNFQVADQGVAEGEAASYLVGQKGGRWYVVDKKRGERFTADSVKLGYKGWFDSTPDAAKAQGNVKE